MLLKNFFFVLAFMFGLLGCATKEYHEHKSVFIVFKTPVFKYADLGFIYENADDIKIELYNSGEPMMALTIGKENICMSLFECLDKKSFNQKVLNQAYPGDILRHIFRGEEIFSGLNRIETRNGFTQTFFKADKYNINYSVLNNQIIFRDTMNTILIKVKRLK